MQERFEFEFVPQKDPVARRVIVAIPPQNGKLGVKAIEVPGGIPEPHKAVKKLIVPVINLNVTVDGKPLYDFKDPIRMTIFFEERDYEAAYEVSGSKYRSLAIVTFYQDDKRNWRWERLETIMAMFTNPSSSPYMGTVTAYISHLQPNDPEGLGTP